MNINNIVSGCLYHWVVYDSRKKKQAVPTFCEVHGTFPFFSADPWEWYI